MTIRQFLDAGFTLLVEQYVRLGSTVFEAIQKINAPVDDSDVPAVGQNASVEQIDNDSALAEIQRQLAGVSFK